MPIKLGVVMDPFDSLHIDKDSTLALLYTAAHLGWEIYYFTQQTLFLENSLPYGLGRLLTIPKGFQTAARRRGGRVVEQTKESMRSKRAKPRGQQLYPLKAEGDIPDPLDHLPQHWTLATHDCLPLAELDILLMPKDPPCDNTYFYTTYLLERAEQLGVLVSNRPAALRNNNEKILATHFPACCPPTLVTASINRLQLFLHDHRHIVCKPLHTMGGRSVFQVQVKDPNVNVIFETLTCNETLPMMAQRFLPAIYEGDKRILMINGSPVSHGLIRVPKTGDWRGNLAAGATSQVQALSAQDAWICEQVGPYLREQGLHFVGLDIIGHHLTEVNITSPTGIRELEAVIGHAVISHTLLSYLAEQQSST